VRPRNETLDCRVYARAAAMAHRLDAYRPRDWATLEERLGLGPPPVPADPPINPTISVPEVVDQPEPAFRVPSPSRRRGGRAPSQAAQRDRAGLVTLDEHLAEKAKSVKIEADLG
jgi:phage terminase large subunit GpA-like protein